MWTANLGGGSAAAGAFSTAPLSTATPITLVSFGDYGSGTAHEYAVGRLAAAEHPALFLSAGDNAYLLAATPFLDRAIFRPLHALLAEAPAVAALGEHDLAYRDGAAVISALHLPGHQYSVQYGPVQVVVLGLEADASALDYARKALGRCSGPCPVRFVLTHRPISANNPIMPLLRQRHVAAILAGHLHRYERHVRGGVLQFTIGTGGEGAGSAAYTLATPDAIVSFIAYGYLRIGIAGDRISYQFIDQSGRVRDRVEQTIPGSPRYSTTCDVDPAARQVGDEGHDQDGQHDADRPVAKAEPTAAVRDRHPVRKGRAQRPRHDVREPERQHRIHSEAPVRHRRHRDQHGKHDPGAEVAQPQRPRGHVTGGRAQRERGQHRRPVEQLAPPGEDAVNRERQLAALPGHEHRRQDDRVERGRDDVGNPQAHVQHIRGHRAEHPHHGNGQPVDPGHVAAGPQLQPQRCAERGQPDQDGGRRPETVHQEVRRGLTHAGRQHLDDPEVGGDLGDAAETTPGRRLARPGPGRS